MLKLNIFSKIKPSLTLLLIIFEYVFYPYPIIAKAEYDISINVQSIKAESLPGEENGLKSHIADMKNDEESAVFSVLPKNNGLTVKKSLYTTLTSYTSDVAQCDKSPCTTATGFNVCEHGIEDTVAANFLSFGTKIRIPDYFGDRVFIVRDRMSRKHQNRIDIWMENRADALQFGIKRGRVEILD
jgi:3D (Asp-Asp-Asp) domain-containing protein